LRARNSSARTSRHDPATGRAKVGNARRVDPVAGRMEHVADRAIWKLAIGIIIIVGVVALLCRRPPGEQPYKMVNDLVATDLSRWTGQELKIHGWVVADSIVDVWRHQPTTSFVLQKDGKQIRVIATTPSTWLLRPQMELVAQGHLVPASSLSIVDAACATALDGADPAERCRVALAEQDHVFIATALNGRCPSKYDGFERCACPPAPNDRFL
jgi:hypothetical protein